MVALIDISKNSDSSWDCSELELGIESQIAATMPNPITWQEIRDAVSKDKLMNMLADQISDGFPPDKKTLKN